MEMTFQQLQYILEIGKSGSVTAAAKALFVSSSSVSISLSALEKELGYSLFSRTQKGLVPTEGGALVLEYAEQILRTHALLNGVGQETTRILRISCTDQPPVAKAVAQLLYENKDRTDLRIENVSYPGDETYRKMMEREIELGISTTISYALGSWEKRLRKGGLHRQILKVVPAVIKVGPGHRLYHADHVRPYDLRDDFYIDDPNNPTGSTDAFGGNLYIDPDRVFRLSKPGIRREALLQGMGYIVGVMPPKHSEDPLRSIPLEGGSFYFSAVTNTQIPAQPECVRLIELCKQYLDEAYPDY